ncbi:MAG: tetratricopeptide repeat protein, partial [Rhodospirillales bacterium]|nr:tetratricopeptide repeat protein [Rhodospirillales bacterium]
MVRERIKAIAAELGVDPTTIPPARPRLKAAASAPAAAPGGADMVRRMVDSLAARLEQSPEDVDGWLRLGRSYRVLNEMPKARQAIEKARTLKPDDVNVKLALADIILAEAGNPETLPPAFVAVMKDILAQEPENGDALYFMGLAAAQTGDGTAARQAWTRLLAQLPPEAPERAQLQKQIEALPK